ncbi:PAS domain-containing protein [Qipengyuania qiaonensis]
MDRLGGFFGSRDQEEDFDDDFVDEADADLDPPPSPVGQDERRMQVRAYNHWASLLGDLSFPHVSDLEPEKLDDFGPYSVLLDLSDDIEDPQVAFVGAELAEECGYDSMLGRLSEVPSRSVLSRITDHYMQILANQAPIGFEAEFINERGATMLYRGILLPYSSDNETIDFIYGVINWKEMADRQTADELLLAIDQALGTADDNENDFEDTVETAETLTFGAGLEHDQDVLDLGDETMMDNHSNGSLPKPSFGAVADDEDAAIEAVETAHPGHRVDALGNPVGGHGASEQVGMDDEGEDDFDSTIKTAADYGLPNWDDEEEYDDDVEGVVDPLADEDTASSLISLVSRGGRTKKSVDLSNSEPAPAIPQAFDDEGFSLPPRMPQAYEAPAEDPATAFGETDDEPEGHFGLSIGYEKREDDDPADKDAVDSVAGDEPIDDDGSPAGLHDCLAAAREMAQAAQNTEDRSRKALYSAVGRAYDFSLEAQKAPDDFDELLVDNGLTFQDRAPMTPIVKLVFGADYDKTRLTEYAAVLMHAHRVGVERGKLATFLREAEGGLKGVVNAERNARKEEQGKPVGDKKAVRATLARKLRALEPLSLADLDEDGAEFALVMVRRTPEGKLEVIGEVPEDVPLVERAARKLLG